MCVCLFRHINTHPQKLLQSNKETHSGVRLEVNEKIIDSCNALMMVRGGGEEEEEEEEEKEEEEEEEKEEEDDFVNKYRNFHHPLYCFPYHYRFAVFFIIITLIIIIIIIITSALGS